MVYFPEEEAKLRIEVRETTRAKDIGLLYLSNYRMHFQPHAIKDYRKATIYTVPYGYIYRVMETSNEAKSTGEISVYCKDERMFKFKFENNMLVYREALRVLNESTQIANQEQLYCYGAAKHAHISSQTKEDPITTTAVGDSPNLVDHNHVKALVFKEFERLGIANNPSRFCRREHASG